MEMRQLQYFQEVCRSGSFTKAAINLFVAQPVITNAIHKLEDELGVRLLNRTNKAVSMTAEGEVLLERVDVLLGLADEIFQEMCDFNMLNKGSLRLGVPPQIGNYLFPRLFAEFSVLYPKLNLVVSEEVSGVTISLLEKGDLDVGIVVLPESLPNMETRFLFTQPIVLCVAKSHRLNGCDSVDWAQLQDEKFIMRKPGSIQRDLVIRQCQQHGFSPNIIFSTSQIQTIKTLVTHNLGIAFLMEITVQGDSSLHVIPLTEPTSVKIGLAWKKGRYVSKAVQTFINFVIDAYRH